MCLKKAPPAHFYSTTVYNCDFGTTTVNVAANSAIGTNINFCGGYKLLKNQFNGGAFGTLLNELISYPRIFTITDVTSISKYKHLINIIMNRKIKIYCQLSWANFNWESMYNSIF